MLLEPNPDDVRSSFNASNTKDESETIPSAPLQKLLRSQQKALEDQSKAIKLLTAHVQDLTNTVHTLQQSVERLEGSQAPKHQTMKTSTTPNIEDRDSNANDNTPDENMNANANQFHDNNHNNNARQENHNDFQRAHVLAHHVAWRIATFPLRAVFFYLKYEYRIWLVMYRLAGREVLNPFREAGMIFQLGFALIIVYGRIAPALENAVNERRREQQQQQEGGGDDDYYAYDEAFLEDAEFQIQTIVTAIFVGFLYHVGVFGLVYRFFFRDRLHIRIWKDLREGVELTPTYGLDFEREEPPETGDNENMNQNNNDRNNDNNHEQAARNNNNANDNNIPRPPNRNHNRGNVNEDGPLFEMANAIGNGINDFFMGHGRRRRAVQEQEGAEAHDPPQPAADGGGGIDVNPIPNHRNPILGLISDLLCLLYSFFVSILPGWNYEQQLRDMRDEEDMRLRVIMEREAEALRNQNMDDSDESDSEDEDGM